MKKYGIVIDVANCNGCYNCFLACKDEHCGEEFPGYSAAEPMTGQHWINLVEVERGARFQKSLLSKGGFSGSCERAANHFTFNSPILAPCLLKIRAIG